MSVNRVIIVGNLGRDPETRTTAGGSSVTSFSVATSEKYKGKDGQRQEETTWHNCVTFGKLAEICAQYLTKGKTVYLEGKIKTRSYDDKEGNKKYVTEIIVDQMQMLGGGESRGSSEPRGGSDQSTWGDVESVPF